MCRQACFFIPLTQGKYKYVDHEHWALGNE